jgi:hypothetical protein
MYMGRVEIAEYGFRVGGVQAQCSMHMYMADIASSRHLYDVKTMFCRLSLGTSLTLTSNDTMSFLKSMPTGTTLNKKKRQNTMGELDHRYSAQKT